MNASKMILAGAVVAAVIVAVHGYIGRGSPEDARSLPRESVETLDPARGAAPRTRPVSSAEATSAPSAVPTSASATAADAAEEAPPVSPAGGWEEATRELMQEMASDSYRLLDGRDFVDYLVSSGLAPSDAERVVERGFRDGVECWLEAVRAQAEAENVPLDSILLALQAMVFDSDGPLLSGLIDTAAVRAREATCTLNVLQEAGIPPHVLEESALR